jgi:hypothetical protein
MLGITFVMSVDRYAGHAASPPIDEKARHAPSFQVTYIRYSAYIYFLIVTVSRISVNALNET